MVYYPFSKVVGNIIYVFMKSVSSHTLLATNNAFKVAEVYTFGLFFHG